MGGQICREMAKGVNSKPLSRDNDPISFEKAVSFVTWQYKFVECVLQSDCVATSDLLPVLESKVVRE